MKNLYLPFSTLIKLLNIFKSVFGNNGGLGVSVLSPMLPFFFWDSLKKNNGKRLFKKLVPFVLIFIVAVFGAVAGSLVSDSAKVSNTGVFASLPELSTNTDFIDWGNLAPNDTSLRTVELSTTKPLKYSITYVNPVPYNLFDFVEVSSNASSYIADKELITFELRVLDSASELLGSASEISFSFDVVFSGL